MDQKLDIKRLLDLFQKTEETQQNLKGKDIIMLAGPTGSGKSTTANYLLGREMQIKLTTKQEEVDGEIYDNEDEVIDSNGEFKIGHSKCSQTLQLQIVQVINSFFLCDSPGFFDNRGTEIEIVNGCQLKQFIANCNSIKLVIIISYFELVSQRGAQFIEIFKLVSRILKRPEKEQFEKITFLFTKVPKDKKVNTITKEVLSFISLVSNNDDYNEVKMKDFLKVILSQIKSNSFIIVDPLDKNNQNTLKIIMDQTPIANPSEEFCFGIQEKSNLKLISFVAETSNYVIKMQQRGNYLSIMETMIDFKKLKDYTGDGYLLVSYEDLQKKILNDFGEQKNKAFEAFKKSAEQCKIISSQNIQDLVDLIQQLKVIDQYKAQVFEKQQFKTSENEFKAEIEGVCSEMGEMITKQFPQEIENVKSYLLKLQAFSQQTSLGQQIYTQSQQEIKHKFQQEKQKLQELMNQFYIKQSFFDVNLIKNNVNLIAEKLKFLKQIDEFLKNYIINPEEQNFFEVLIKSLQNSNYEILSNLKKNIDKIYEELKEEKFFNDEIFIDFDHILPGFEIIILKTQSLNMTYCENIPDCENNYNQAIQYLKEFNSNINSLIEENTEDEFHLKKLGFILKILDKMRNQLDDFILAVIADDYKEIKQQIKKKISKKAEEAKRILQIYQQEIEENSDDEEDDVDDDDDQKSYSDNSRKSITSYKKDFQKLQKTIDFLSLMKWTDEYFKIKFTQTILQELRIIDKDTSNNVMCSDFVKQIKSISQEYQQIQLAIKGYTFIELSHKIQKVFSQMASDYQQKKDQMEDLQEIQVKYDSIQVFVEIMDEIDLLKQEFKILPIPKEIINQIFSKLDTLIRNEEFQDLDQELEQLAKLKNKNNQQQLEKYLTKFSQKILNEIKQINSIFNQLKNDNTNFEEMVLKNLEKISQILQILQKFKPQLFQDLQNDLDQLLNDLIQNLDQYQKKEIIANIKKVNFTVMEHRYNQINKFVDCLAKFKNIFKKDQWKAFTEQGIEKIKKQIEISIFDLHITNELISLISLLSKLKETQQSHSEFEVIFEKEIENTNNQIKALFDKTLKDIKTKIQSEDVSYPKDLKYLEDFTQKILNIDLQQHKYCETKIFEIEALINEQQDQKFLDIQTNLMKGDLIYGRNQLQSMKKLDEKSFNKMVNMIQNNIQQSESLIRTNFPTIEVQIFKNNFLTILNNMQLIEIFLAFNQQECQNQMKKNLMSHLQSQQYILLEECNKILSQSDSNFTQQQICNLFKHHDFFKIINDKKEISQYFEINQQLFKDILIKISVELKSLQQAQTLLINNLQVRPNLNKNWRRYDSLLALLNLKKEFFDTSDEIQNIKKIGLELVRYDTLQEEIRKKFNCCQQDFDDALKKGDFFKVKNQFNQLNESSLINQEFNIQFIDMNFLQLLLLEKVNKNTEQAKKIIHNGLSFNSEMNQLINQISSADENLQSINSYCHQNQIQIIEKELIIQIDEELNNIEQYCNHKELQVISQTLIKIFNISQQVSKFQIIVEKKILQAISYIKKILGEDIIFDLGQILKEDSNFGALIVNKFPAFESFKTKKFNEQVAKHDINYILKKLQLSQKGKKSSIDNNLKEELLKYYNHFYLKIFDKIIEEFKYKKQNWHEIIQKVKDKSKSINYDNNNSQNAKQYVLEMIACICAYWSLNTSVEQKPTQKNVFKKPNHTQILSIIMLLGITQQTGLWQGFQKFSQNNNNNNNNMESQRQLIEILTGEGKSITLGFCSLTLALLEYEVDVICYSSYLSERDYKDFRQLFMSFGVLEKIKYMTFKELCEELIQQNLNNLNIRQITLDLINECKYNIQQSQKISKNKILLIDEIDVFFNPAYYGQTFNPSVDFINQEVECIIRQIWQKREQENNSIVSDIYQTDDYTKLVNKYPKFKQLFNRHIQQLALDVKKAENHKQQYDYIVKNNKIGYKQMDSTYCFATSYSYLTLFAYFDENSKGKIDDQSLQKQIQLTFKTSFFSYAQLPDLYFSILGVTGTLQSLNKQMKQYLEKYKITSEVYMPSMFGESQLDFRQIDMVKVESDLNQQYLQILNISKQSIQNEQSVIIFFKNKKSLEEYHNSNYTYIPQQSYILLTDHQNLQDVDLEIQRATLSGQIGLFTCEYGRGTDFVSLDPKINKQGGIVVIQTFLSDTLAEEVQIKGRTARQGQPGQYYLILNEADLIKDFNITSQQIQQWKNNQNIKTLYANLNEIRNELEEDKYKQIEINIQNAKNKHDKSMEFAKNIKEQDYAKAIDYINQFS
ncbi:hypothetical protein ABPG72_017504 [Tetrahymena utriculariae]